MKKAIIRVPGLFFLLGGGYLLASAPESEVPHKHESQHSSSAGENTQALKAKEKQKEVTDVPPPPPLSAIDAYVRKVTGPAGKTLGKVERRKVLPPEPTHKEPAEIKACKERLQARYKECLEESEAYGFNGEKKCAAFKQWFKGRCAS